MASEDMPANAMIFERQTVIPQNALVVRIPNESHSPGFRMVTFTSAE